MVQFPCLVIPHILKAAFTASLLDEKVKAGKLTCCVFEVGTSQDTLTLCGKQVVACMLAGMVAPTSGQSKTKACCERQWCNNT